MLLGAAFGLALLALTLAQVDVAGTASIVAAASPVLVGLALLVVLLDLGLRAARWRALVRGAGPERESSFRLALGYLTVGYLANQLLPARLGDLVRAYLSGQALGMSRLAALGTIMVERLTDGATMLLLALASSFVLAGVALIDQLALLGLALGGIGVAGAALGGWILWTGRLERLRLGRLLRDLVQRVTDGMAGVRTRRGLSSLLLWTTALTSTAVAIGWLVAAATGLALSPLESVLFISAIALSLAIPAAPAAIGTFEFTGVLVLTSLGASPEQSLATVVLLRAVTGLPPVLLGVASFWALHLRAGPLLQRAGADANAETVVPSDTANAISRPRVLA